MIYGGKSDRKMMCNYFSSKNLVKALNLVGLSALFVFSCVDQSACAGDNAEVKAAFYRDDLNPELAGGAIQVTRPDGSWEQFDRTGRDYETYGKKFFKGIAGKKVLDAGCGAGTVAYQMNGEIPLPRGAEIPAQFIGLDIALSERQKTKPYFIQADMAKLPFADGSFDVVMTNWSVFSYPGGSPALRKLILSEFRRVLKKGGYLRIGDAISIDHGSGTVAEQYSHALAGPGGLKLSAYGRKGSHGQFLEFLKTDETIEAKPLNPGICLMRLLPEQGPRKKPSPSGS